MPPKKTLVGRVAGTLMNRMSRGRLPQTDGTLIMPALNEPVEVFRDPWGIPHIYAQNTPDLFFAQGFVHSQDRFFQMELNRRIAAGRLSELFGENALETDRFVRTFGFNRLGRADFENAHPEVREALSAYAAGVNAYLEHPACKLPLELSLLSLKPDPWTPEDCAIYSRLMIWRMSHAWQGELVRAEIAEKIGTEHAAELDIHYPSGNPITLPEGIDFNALDPDGTLKKVTGPFLARGQGSNEWVVGPSRSQSGRAVLANDMHLPLGIPSLWYQVHLNAPDTHVSGVSLAGLPMVLVGHNERIAWGITLAFSDAEDLFVEQIDSQDPPRYLYQDQWHPAEVIEESIKIKGIPDPFIEKVLVTRHGPVISDRVGKEDQKIAVQSYALRPAPALEGWMRLNQAQNWDEFVAAVQLIEAPQLNIAYADVEDNIGYWMTGKVPVRAKGDGSIPAPGWSGDFEWTGEVPFEEMPHALNPNSGFILNCNNKPVSPDYPHFLGNTWMNGYRALRLEALIESREKLSLQDHQDFQMDLKCLPGLALVDLLAGIPEEDPDVKLALGLLRGWDGFLTPESIGGTVYQVTRFTLLRELLNPGLGEELATKVMGGAGAHPLLADVTEFFSHDTSLLLRCLADPDSWWVQQAGGRETFLTGGIKTAVTWLRQNLGEDQDQWRWGRLHTLTLTHALSLQKPFDQVFDRGPFPIGGDGDTPMQTSLQPDDPYANKASAPSFRQIIDMGDLPGALAIHPVGQSGHLASPHYDDFIGPWLEGTYNPMLWTRQQVEDQAVQKLTLEAVKKEPQ